METTGRAVNFIVVVVCYNAGTKLKETLDSIYAQDYWGYRVIIKDGGSTDGSIESLDENDLKNTKIIKGKDNGIYDAMNIAVKDISGDEHSYVIFMNCGDTFHDRQVLGKVADYITESGYLDSSESYIFYGSQYNMLTEAVVSPAPKLNDFALYRNVPCHQVCFYDARLMLREDGPYKTKYRVRADYEHFLYCVYGMGARTERVDIVVSNYEGGGFSETEENRKVSVREHQEITHYYMGGRADRYRRIMILSGAGIRTKLAESRRFAGVYNRIKTILYR